MKRLTILLIIFYQSSSICFSQDSISSIVQVGGINRYSETPPIKLENATLRVWYAFTQKVKNRDNVSVKCDTMVLVTGNNYSVYYDWNREHKYKTMTKQLASLGKKMESISYRPVNEFLEIAMDDKLLTQTSLNRENSEILKDRKKEIITTTDFDDSNALKEFFYLVEERVPPQRWQFQESSKKILGYICQEATCQFKGKNYTAWFTLDIPINEGPYKFYGLPGLILMLEDAEKRFEFIAIGLEKLSGVEIVSENKDEFIKCTPEQYKKIKKRMIETQYLYYPKERTLYYTKKRISGAVNIIEKD